MTTEQRLDDIERLLGTVAVSLQTTALNLQTLAATTAANQLAAEQRMTAAEQRMTASDQRMTRVEAAIDRLEVQVASNTASIDRVVKSLEDSVSDLVTMIGRSVEQGDQDRAEIRRILDYLFGQQRNGNGRSEGT